MQVDRILCGMVLGCFVVVSCIEHTLYRDPKYTIIYFPMITSYNRLPDLYIKTSEGTFRTSLQWFVSANVYDQLKYGSAKVEQLQADTLLVHLFPKKQYQDRVDTLRIRLSVNRALALSTLYRYR